jgi:cytidine deaminase
MLNNAIMITKYINVYNNTPYIVFGGIIMDSLQLIKLAKAAMENAYVPYSHFKVGAALLTDNNEVYTGCNIENASFGGTNCAERTALFKAISEGKRKFKSIAIISESSGFTYPCGICRQVLSEFCMDIDVIIANNKEEFKLYKFSEIFPFSFTGEDLERSSLNGQI